MSSVAWLILYSVFIVLASLAGGALPTVVRMTHTRTQLTMSFVGGLMLGVGLLHLLPHAAVELGSVDRATLGALAGMLTMFFLIRMFHFHEHGPLPLETDGQSGASQHQPRPPDAHHHHPAGRPHRLSWVGVGIGMVVHSLIDGVALAAGILPLKASAAHTAVDSNTAIVGGAVFLAIFLHKPLDAMSITWVMAAGGSSRRAMRRVNFAFAWVCPIGAALFYYSTPESESLRAVVVGGAMAFSAGVFLCIALSDLLPELQFHAHDRIMLSCSLLAGVALAYGIGLLEPHGLHQLHEHNHEHEHEADPNAEPQRDPRDDHQGTSSATTRRPHESPATAVARLRDRRAMASVSAPAAAFSGMLQQHAVVATVQTQAPRAGVRLVKSPP